MDFYLLLKIWVKISGSVSKNVSGKNSQKLLDYAKKSAKDPPQTTSKKVIQKPAKTTGDLIGNKITDAVTKLYNYDKI